MGFGELALICAVALVGPLLSLPRLLHVPVVIGELTVGIVVGATGLGWLHADNATFHFLGEIGFALVMMVAGSHVPVRDPALLAGLRAGALRAVAIGVLAVPSGMLLASVFGTGHPGLYAVLLASSSASLVMPSLEGITTSAPAIVRLLPQLAIADAACIVVLPLAVDPSSTRRALVGGAAVLVAGALLFLGLRWAVNSGRERRVHELSEDRGLAIELRTSLTLLFGLAAVATAFHVSVMLAGFVAGLALAGAGEPRRLAKQLFALTEGFFGPIFFVWLGASLDLRVVASHPSSVVLGVALGAAAVVLHGSMALTGQPWPVAVVTSAQLGVPVAAVTLGAASGTLGSGEAGAILLGALVTVAATVVAIGRVRALALGGGSSAGVAS
ncbi:MAG: cation:proton antiporter [Nocardioidaceae bacterium]|nr:cation:proton antiporter [Nocardioidaceae bacterium]